MSSTDLPERLTLSFTQPDPPKSEPIERAFKVLEAWAQRLLEAIQRMQLAVGTVELVAGAATVAEASVTDASLIFLTAQGVGGAILGVQSKTPGVGFDIISSSPTDTSTVAWVIVNA